MCHHLRGFLLNIVWLNLYCFELKTIQTWCGLNRKKKKIKIIIRSKYSTVCRIIICDWSCKKSRPEAGIKCLSSLVSQSITDTGIDLRTGFSSSNGPLLSAVVYEEWLLRFLIYHVIDYIRVWCTLGCSVVTVLPSSSNTGKFNSIKLKIW